MKELVTEALELAKKFYNEQKENKEHLDDELIRYYAIEEEIATKYPLGAPQGMLEGWYGAICWLKDILRFEK